LNTTLRHDVSEACQAKAIRLSHVLAAIGIASSSWYRPEVPKGARQRPGPKPKPVEQAKEAYILDVADKNPWYGYQKTGVICRWGIKGINDREVYKVFKKHNLLKKPKARKAEVYQASKLYELLPQGPNELWQMDVTYIHIPGYGWWYAVTVIDYYSRYLLADYLCSSYSALSAIEALSIARERAEQLHGPLLRRPFLVTDNGSSFIAHRFADFIRDCYSHVRIQYRTPTQLGLLERFHRTLKSEEVYWQLYDNPQHARECLQDFRTRYNERRPHWALKPVEGGDVLTPQAVYVEGRRITIPKWQGWAKGAKEKIDKLLEEDRAQERKIA
jgi:transposase InsO family protein